MDDTSREIKSIQQEMWMRLPMEERFRRAAEMNALARAFIERRVPPDATEDERRRFIFREMYGFELPDFNGPQP